MPFVFIDHGYKIQTKCYYMCMWDPNRRGGLKKKRTEIFLRTQEIKNLRIKLGLGVLIGRLTPRRSALSLLSVSLISIEKWKRQKVFFRLVSKFCSFVVC